MAELNVSKKTIAEFFGSMDNKRFIIPDYQRPYKWEIENCETLWNDLEFFFQNEGNKKESTYFLGTIVSHGNEKGNKEIIDGQQRITSLMLLLRAFYKKLENMPQDDEVNGLKKQIGKCLWDIDELSENVTDFSTIHILSEVVTEENNEIFHHILQTGNADNKSKDAYSTNYLFFKDKCDEYAKNAPLNWKKFCICILKKCIILPIECDTQDTALTIFSTLNDRGLPLSDSDIFKAQLYRKSKDRKEFSETWKELAQICEKANITIDDIFRYYMHILRARDNNSGKEIALRRFYMDDKSAQLNKVDITELITLANFWKFIFLDYTIDDIDYKVSQKSKQWIDCLWHYPNEYWKYAVSVFFMKYKDSDNFTVIFEKMLEKLTAFLFAKFIDKPTVNAIKDDIFKTYVGFEKSSDYHYEYKIELDSEIFAQKISEHSSSRMTKALLLLHAYLNESQEKLILNNFDIEHIFPVKWQNTNYNGWQKDDADAYLNNLGNKIVLEKKLNTQAGNGYFGKKKEKYSQSSIEVVKELANYPKDDWLKDDIFKREQQIKEDLIAFFHKNRAK
ncbi:DUF262 domain-containing protein [Moraxella sp. ZJ142]|uniref:DUF262 domain-containing protein n=1 Tax=Moraxella marmotae TaxID=3344520 RepID=UPI0035D43182